MEFELRAPPEVISDLTGGKHSNGTIRAYCSVCDPGREKKDGGTLWAKLIDGRPYWGCHRCHCERDYKASTASMRLEFDLEKQRTQDERKKLYAMEMVDASQLIRRGDACDRYLRGRGLHHGPEVPTTYGSMLTYWSRDLHVAHRQHDVHPITKRSGPTMIAIARDEKGHDVGCQQIFLHELPDGRVVKVSDPEVPGKFRHSNAKISRGPIRGCAVRLGHDESADTIGVCEGVETALGFAVRLGLPCWATLGAGGMKALAVPDGVRSVVIGPDVGDSNGTGSKAAFSLKRRLLEGAEKAGRRLHVEILPPPIGEDWADWAKHQYLVERAY